MPRMSADKFVSRGKEKLGDDIGRAIFYVWLMDYGCVKAINGVARRIRGTWRNIH